MHTRHAAPFTGLYTFPGGALFYGEGVEELVQRQLIEKVGLQLQLEHKGIANLRHMRGGKAWSHNYAHIYCTRVNGRPLIKAKDTRFTPEWIKPVITDQKQLIPDVQNIIEATELNKDFFYLEVSQDR